MEALLKNIPEIDQLAPRLQPWGGNGGNNVVHGIKTGAYNITGDYPAINKIDPVRILNGRFINEIDLQNKRKVAVIGNRVRDELFKNGEAIIGEYIRINGVYYQVVGVFEPKNKNINFGGEKDKSIFIPFTTMQVSYNLGDDVHYFLVTAKPNKSASVVEEKSMKLLADRNHVAPEDEQAFGHFNLEKEFKKMNGLFLGIRILIWIVGTGTLLAGVIGVSNIMLIIIKERTREIGIQRAIGATPWRIISQVITESVTLTAVAGSFGLVLGVFLLEVINNMLAASAEQSQVLKNPEVDIQVALTALIVLIISGVVAGLIPARKAVSMKPVEALRYE